MKKKIILLLMVFSIQLSFINAICASSINERINFEINTVRDEEMDGFVTTHICDLLISQDEHVFESNAVIGQGIKVFQTSHYDQYIYPIFEDNKVIGTFTVSRDSVGNLHGTYSQAFAEELNYIFRDNTDDYVTLVDRDGEILAVYGQKIYSFQSHITEINQNNIASRHNSYANIALTCYSASQLTNNRAIYTYCNWTTYYVLGYESLACVPITLFNIFKNEGYTGYSSWDNVGTDLRLANNLPSSHANGYTYEHIREYFSYKGITSSPRSIIGRLSFSSCVSSISSGKYILALTHKSSNSNEHALGIVGVSVNNTTNTLIFFDPFATSSGSSKYYVVDTGDSVYPLITTNISTYIWNDGYYAGIQI